jgi:hypothetical protein
MKVFRETFGSIGTFLAGCDGLPLEGFLLTPVERLPYPGVVPSQGGAGGV